MNPKSLESTIPHLVYIRVSRDALAFTSDDIEKTAMLIAEDNAHEWEQAHKCKLEIVGIVPKYVSTFGNDILFMFKETPC